MSGANFGFGSGEKTGGFAPLPSTNAHLFSRCYNVQTPSFGHPPATPTMFGVFGNPPPAFPPEDTRARCAALEAELNLAHRRIHELERRLNENVIHLRGMGSSGLANEKVQRIVELAVEIAGTNDCIAKLEDSAAKLRAMMATQMTEFVARVKETVVGDAETTQQLKQLAERLDALEKADE